MDIHKTAVVHPDAKIGAGTVIGAYSVIGPKTVLGENNIVGPHCVFENFTAGNGNKFTASVYAGTPPQDIRTTGEEFRVIVGDNNTFRENVTLNRGTKHDTVIGNDCFLMTMSHIAHDCKVGNNVIMANAATLAGHVEVGDKSVLSGLMAIHQFVRVGRMTMLSGLTGCVMDIPPFCVATGTRAELAGLNLVGMRRGGVPRENISKVREAYKVLFLRGLRLEEALAQLKTSSVPEVAEMVAFIEGSKRGIARARLKVDNSEEVEA